ncbi:MAG: MBOAT family protein [Halioglobus sp.]|nr:MBOAT family protein [Halioglobus sp.]
MPFTSPLFIVFILVFFPAFWLLEQQSRKAALGFTAVVSFLFVFINFPLFSLIPLAQSAVLLMFQKSQKKSGFQLAVAIVLFFLPLLSFKYTDFFSNAIGGPSFGLTLPLGISFYTFTVVGFAADIYLRKYEMPKPSFIDNVNILTYWPHLASGPILRGNQFFRKDNYPKLMERDFVTAAVLIVFGLYKKLVIGDSAGGLVNQNLEMGVGSMAPLDAWSTIFGFSAQIYGDFSGYSDMALGFAIMMGIFIPANFNFPYSSRSITEFWRRWHISLSSWFRDYLYIPLGGNRNGILVGSAVLMLVFTTSGLWHGAAWNFIIWGAIHGGILIVERLGRSMGISLPGVISWPLTFLAVSLAWCFFFLDFQQATALIMSAFVGSGDKLQYNNVAILFFVALVIVDFIFRPYRVVNEEIKATRTGIIFAPVVLTLLFYFAGESLPFIYFDF